MWHKISRNGINIQLACKTKKRDYLIDIQCDMNGKAFLNVNELTYQRHEAHELAMMLRRSEMKREPNYSSDTFLKVY